ncbi:hypothetical protein CAPTEDRAFT_228850 [Capitella teleta]|uniref:Uncharacterized protein n=1 Tax=Capitella teleta TaxID=283909 RepID=R7T4X7_CAPTE|nr:hypothetical protein CAPTEDRAFT_228850 [Capitella teleta]|eukprot:ELT88162.1 hypothetical protein CAPTEDRAFT_228850 [Capitella teleta]
MANCGEFLPCLPDHKSSPRRRYSFSKAGDLSVSEQAREYLTDASILSPVSRSQSRSSKSRESLRLPHDITMSWEKQLSIMRNEELEQPTSSRNRRESIAKVCKSARSCADPSTRLRRPIITPRLAKSANHAELHRMTNNRKTDDKRKKSVAICPIVTAFKKQVNNEVEIFPFWGQLSHRHLDDSSKLPSLSSISVENFIYEFEKTRKENPSSAPYKNFYARISQEMFNHHVP